MSNLTIFFFSFQRLRVPHATRHPIHYPGHRAPTVQHTHSLPPLLNSATAAAQHQNRSAAHLSAALNTQPPCAMTLRPPHPRPCPCTSPTAPYPCRPRRAILHTLLAPQTPTPPLTTAPRLCAGTRTAHLRGRRPASARQHPGPPAAS